MIWICHSLHEPLFFPKLVLIISCLFLHFQDSLAEKLFFFLLGIDSHWVQLQSKTLSAGAGPRSFQKLPLSVQGESFSLLLSKEQNFFPKGGAFFFTS